MPRTIAIPGSATEAEPLAPPRRAVAAWASYELALALFATNVAAVYFPLWVIDDAGGSDAAYGIASSAAVALVLVAAPLLGALSDLAPRRMPFLVAATLVCVGFTALLGSGGLLVSLACFVVASAAQQTAALFADTLLPEVSTAASHGRVGGVGVAFGLGGAFLGVGVGFAVLAVAPGAKSLDFKQTALLVLLLALP